eukprot:scaffold529968_cov50-Prasinocladus_malaysianus.AAC.2
MPPQSHNMRSPTMNHRAICPRDGDSSLTWPFAMPAISLYNSSENLMYHGNSLYFAWADRFVVIPSMFAFRQDKTMGYVRIPLEGMPFMENTHTTYELTVGLQKAPVKEKSATKRFGQKVSGAVTPS